MPGQVRLSEEQIAEMRRLRADGATVQQLTARFQCSEATVRVYCPTVRNTAKAPPSASRPSVKDTLLEGSYHWGHRHRGGKRVAIKPRICKCSEKLGTEGCGGAEYVPTSRSQRYSPECARRIWEVQHGRAWPEEKTAKKAAQNAVARSPRTDSEVVRNKRWETTRPKQYICQTCYGLPHAEERRNALARFIDGARKVSIVGCPECGAPPGEEQLERRYAISSSASWAVSV